MSTNKRIAKEFSELSQEPPEGFNVTLAGENGDDLHRWHVVLAGPPNTPYAGGQFGILVVLPSDYPFKGPVITFVTRIYHPNITNDNLGNVCLSLLKPENWKPSTRLRTVLDAVRQLLIAPQPDDPLEARIADEYRQNRADFEHQATQYVSKYAKSAPKFASGSA